MNSDKWILILTVLVVGSSADSCFPDGKVMITPYLEEFQDFSNLEQIAIWMAINIRISGNCFENYEIVPYFVDKIYVDIIIDVENKELTQISEINANKRRAKIKYFMDKHAIEV